MKHIIALVLGTLFGLILVKAEVLSWFRIQEMFAFQSFHMYGIIGGRRCTQRLAHSHIQSEKRRRQRD